MHNCKPGQKSKISNIFSNFKPTWRQIPRLGRNLGNAKLLEKQSIAASIFWIFPKVLQLFQCLASCLLHLHWTYLAEPLPHFHLNSQWPPNLCPFWQLGDSPTWLVRIHILVAPHTKECIYLLFPCFTPESWLEAAHWAVQHPTESSSFSRCPEPLPSSEVPRVQEQHRFSSSQTS